MSVMLVVGVHVHSPPSLHFLALHLCLVDINDRKIPVFSCNFIARPAFTFDLRSKYSNLSFIVIDLDWQINQFTKL